MEDYWCIFSSNKPCSVKKEYKLRPESLVHFCQICDTRESSLKTNQPQIAIEALVHFLDKNLIPLLKTFTETQRMMGKAQAEADIYKKLFDKVKERDGETNKR